MIKMGWEDIIKRPFDVSRAREEALEDYDKTLSNIQIMKKLTWLIKLLVKID